MSTSPYDRWADLYDSVYSYVTEDIPFYVEEALSAGGPVLELGCGTGRVSIPMADAGAEVVGLDSSPAMLEVARRKAARRPKGPGSLALVEGDMRRLEASPAADMRFALAVIPFRGFLALLSVEDQVRTLEGVAALLAPGGRLVFDVFVPDLDMLVQAGDSLYHHRDVYDRDTGRRLIIWHQSSYDNHNQVVNARAAIDVLDDANSVAGRTYRDFQLRYAHRWEVQHLLARCGYRVLELYGDFRRSPFDETSADMVWMATPVGSCPPARS